MDSLSDPMDAAAGRRIVVDAAAGRRSGAARPSPARRAPTATAAAPGDARGCSACREPRRDAELERMRTEELRIAYGEKLAVNQVSLPVRQGEVLALIGPSGCGKTTLLRSLNRLVELTPTAARGGRILLDGEDVDRFEVTELRRRVGHGLPAAQPVPDEHLRQRRLRAARAGLAEALAARAASRRSTEALHRAGLCDEVKDNLDHPALRLSGGQQQRLCIARALAARPEVLLLDEPCSALDPLSTAMIEELILGCASEVAVVIVTHNLQQAQRVADHVAFMYLGELVEYGDGRAGLRRAARASAPASTSAGASDERAARSRSPPWPCSPLAA